MNLLIGDTDNADFWLSFVHLVLTWKYIYVICIRNYLWAYEQHAYLLSETSYHMTTSPKPSKQQVLDWIVVA